MPQHVPHFQSLLKNSFGIFYFRLSEIFKKLNIKDLLTPVSNKKESLTPLTSIGTMIKLFIKLNLILSDLRLFCTIKPSCGKQNNAQQKKVNIKTSILSI